MIWKLFVLIVGFALLIKGADVLVDGSSSIALNLKVPKVLIGLTIVAFGTSAPELAVSISARLAGSDDMVLGNVIGSSIMNIMLILAVGSIIRPVIMKDNTIKKELPLHLILSLLLVVLIIDVTLDGNVINQITRSDALAILLYFSIFIYYLVSVAKTHSIFHEKAPYGVLKSIAFVIIGLGALIYGSNLVVDSASYIARQLHISDRVIALTIVAFGTSLPELVTTITSSLKGEQDLLLGNLIGSNIFNICIVLGLPVAIFGTIEATGFNLIDIIAFILSSVILMVVAKTKATVSRKEGIIMLLIFVIYYSLVIFL
ncbi:MAG: calcium/sodium antiporter [Bacilli bacterium]|nr:calcium/sodium antiporter [Bacilli bacterium]